MPPINLRQVEAFKAVIETGSGSGAAERLGVSQPAISKMLSRLEEDTGLRLFERAGGRLVPTDQAMRLFDEADRMFAGLHQFEFAVEALRYNDRERLTVGVIPGLSRTFAAKVVTAFVANHPNVNVSVEVRVSQFIVEWLSARRLDVGIFEVRDRVRELTSEVILEDELVCVLPVGHRLASRERILATDIVGEPFVAFSPGSESRQIADAALAARDVRANVVVDATTAPMISELVASGVGVTVKHPALVDAGLDNVVVRPFDPPVSFGFALARPLNGRNTQLASEFADTARSVALTILGTKD